MSAAVEMPYFIKPSRLLSPDQKRVVYNAARQAILSILGDEADEQVKMVTINCLLKTHIPYFLSLTHI